MTEKLKARATRNVKGKAKSKATTNSSDNKKF